MTQEVSIKILHWQNCVTRHNAFLQSRNHDLNLKYGLTNVTFGGFYFLGRTDNFKMYNVY